MDTPEPQDQIIELRHLSGAGARERVRRRFVDGEVVRLRSGFYFPTSVWLSSQPSIRFRIAAHALARGLPGTVFCGEAAAVLDGLVTLGTPAAMDILATRSARSGRGKRTFAHASSGAVSRDLERTLPPIIHRHTRPAVILVTSGELQVVDRYQALADHLSTAPVGRALAVADAAQRQLSHSRAGRLEAQPSFVLACEQLPYPVRRHRATAIAALALPGAESPAESLSRALMLQGGFPDPELQHEFWDERGLVGRVDFFWPQLRLIGECDGNEKYVNPAMSHGSGAGERIWQEKNREDRLRALGFQVLRWRWADLMEPARFRRMLMGAGLRPGVPFGGLRL